VALSSATVGWIETTFGTSIAEELFAVSHLSEVVGVRLNDGAEIVVKVRPGVRRARACVAGQAALRRDGFPCPRPLKGVDEVEGLAVHGEEYEPGDPGPPTTTSQLVDGLAELLADLIGRSRRLRLEAPRPQPMWLAWDHAGADVWPDDPWEKPPDWLAELARRARVRLLRAELDEVVGHGDWEIQNMAWRDGRVHVVHDWDSLTATAESALVGAAAATFPSGAQPVLASLADSERFLSSYQAVARWFTGAEAEVAWAAGIWLAAHNARMEVRYGKPPFVLRGLEVEGSERLARAGA
jgi:hypothetical protein